MIKAGRLTGTAEYEIERLKAIAAFDEDVKAYITEYVEQSRRETENMFNEAAEMSVANDIRLSGVKAVPYKDNEYLKQLTVQIAATTNETYENLTATLAFLDRSTGKPMSFRNTFIKSLDLMELSVSTGLESYDTVIKRTVKDLASKGVIDKKVFYITDTGKKVYRNLDTVVRQTLFGGLRLMTRVQAEYNAKLLKTDVYQITWHSGHRGSHGWGGLRYSLSGSYGLPTRDELFAQYGGGSLDDYGCRHDIIAVDPDAPPMYSQEELDRLEAAERETKKWNDKDLNRYEQEQMKRRYERKVREIRREQTISKELLENATKEDKERFARDYYALKNKNNITTREYEKFCEKMGLNTEKNRIYYDGRGRLGGAIPKKYKS